MEGDFIHSKFLAEGGKDANQRLSNGPRAYYMNNVFSHMAPSFGSFQWLLGLSITLIIYYTHFQGGRRAAFVFKKEEKEPWRKKCYRLLRFSISDLV